MQDGVSYRISRNSDEEARKFFYVIPDTGEVILSKPLSDTPKVEFRVGFTLILNGVYIIMY